MVAECFNKYDNINFEGCKTKTTIHDGVKDAMVEDHRREDGFSINDNEGSDEEGEGKNGPMESDGSTMNIKDPTSIDPEILLCEAGTPLYPGCSLNHLTSTLMLLVSCTTFVVPNNFVNELLKLLKETILLKDNFAS